MSPIVVCCYEVEILSTLPVSGGSRERERERERETSSLNVWCYLVPYALIKLRNLIEESRYVH